jgi:hypothetical protein
MGVSMPYASFRAFRLITDFFEIKKETKKSLPTDLIRLNIIEKIIKDQYIKAVDRNSQPSNLYILIENLPRNYSVATRLNMLRRNLSENVAMPVLTSHPTRIITNSAIRYLFDIISSATSLDKKHLATKEQKMIKEQMESDLDKLISQPFLQAENMTPQEEADYTLFIYKKIIEAFPDFFDSVVDKFHEVHGGTRSEIAKILKPAVMDSFRNIYSWTRGDADGNNNVTKKTMEQTLPAQQVAVIEIYIDKINKIRTELESMGDQKLVKNKLKEICAYLHRCINAIKAGIWFNVEGSNETGINITEKFIDVQTNLPKNLQKIMGDLIHLVDLAEFFGGMKEYVRQTTMVNIKVFDNLARILVDHNADIRDLLQNNIDITHKYSGLTRDEKILFHKKLSSNPAYFLVLKENSQQFSKVTIKELDRLLFVLTHVDIFPFYICSDTEDKINFDETLILLRFSSYLHGSLRIHQMNDYPINLLFLCETPKDINNYENILSDILDDPALRKRVKDSGFVSYVGGPSDLGRTGGIVTHISLFFAQMHGQQLLNRYKNKYPDLKKVKLRVLNGYGGDYKRRIGSAAQQIHSTFQGLDAYDKLGAPGAYTSYLHHVVGHRPENDFRVLELENIRDNHPKSFALLLDLEIEGVKSFEEFINKSSSRQLLVELTDAEVERKLNTSSRAGSKTSKIDITKSRAIGITNLYIYTRINWDIFMSVIGWTTFLSESNRDELTVLYTKTTVIKDIVLKVFFAIAISDIPRTWLKLNEGNLPTPAEIKSLIAEYENPDIDEKNTLQTLSYIDKSSHLILETLLLFLPHQKQKEIMSYFKEQSQIGTSSHLLALELMDLIGDEFSVLAAQTRALLVDYQQLTDCIDSYEKDKNDRTLENVVLCLRGGIITSGPDCIAKLSSQRNDYISNRKYVALKK